MWGDGLRALRDVAGRTWRQWQRHRSSEMAAALAFYGALALASLSLVAVYAAVAIASRTAGLRGTLTGQTRHVAGHHNAQFLDAVLREASARHDAWIALAVGAVVFILAVAASALQLQRALDVVWDVNRRTTAREAGRHAPQFALIYALTFLLMCLLFAGAAIHGLTAHTKHISVLRGILMQGLDVGASIVVLTFVFLCIFAYLPSKEIPWRSVWPAAFASAVLYERGQFALAVYFGQMDALSPYADAGALLAILAWLYYSAQVVVAGADLTKVLKERADERRRE